MTQRIIQRLNRDRILLPLLLLLALLFRLPHLNFLLPYFEYGDERDVVEAALRILKSGDPNPHFFWYGSFPIYWTTLLYGLVLGVRCWVSGGINTIGECINNFGVYDQGFLLFYLGRITSIGFGLATIYLTCLLGRKLFSRQTGYLAALFLAISPFHVFFSQVFKVDMSLLFWILLTVHFSLNIYERGGLKDFVWAGVCGGLALSTKYNFFAFLPILLAVGLKTGGRGWFSGKFLFCGYIAAVVFLITCPYSVLDFDTFRNQLGVQMGLNQQHLIQFRTDPSSFLYRRFFYQIFILFPFFFGPLICLAASLGLVRFLRKDWRKSLIFISFPVIYFVFSGSVSQLAMPQYQLPYLPFVVILGVEAMRFFLAGSNRSRWAGGLLLGLSLLFFLSDLWVPHFQGQFQVYRKAGGWINQEIPKDKKVATYFGVYSSTRHFGFQNELVVRRATDFSLAGLEKYDPDFLVTTESSIFQEERFKKSFQGYREVMQAISREEKYRLVRSFRPEGGWESWAGIVYPEIKGFRISIYKKE
ncbi:MAG: glycosyltransferase family 39 protein [Proteobacteria bacterium]|nr:glycosyltransferase family 39 protein [Pseudomonadota bacterium]